MKEKEMGLLMKISVAVIELLKAAKGEDEIEEFDGEDLSEDFESVKKLANETPTEVKAGQVWKYVRHDEEIVMAIVVKIREDHFVLISCTFERLVAPRSGVSMIRALKSFGAEYMGMVDEMIYSPLSSYPVERYDYTSGCYSSGKVTIQTKHNHFASSLQKGLKERSDK